jgi:CBS domain containing-hemolysin-like protein
MSMLGYTLGVMGLCVILIVFSFLDRIYRQLGRVATGTLREHSEIFESEIEPRLKLDRRRATMGFAILANLALVAVAVETARGVLLFVPVAWQAAVQLIVYVTVEVLICMHLLPEIMIARTNTRWLQPLVPVLRGALIVIWPLRAALELAISVGRISEEELPPGMQAQQNGIEALVEAAQEGGMLAGDKAQLIEQVVEFSDKRVLEVMTPRPDIVAIPANATIEQMKRLLVETKFSRLVVYQQTLDDVVGIAQVQDLLQIPESEAKHRTVRELARPALFVPETKLGSDLLKEMRRRNQPMAIAIDEHGLVAGVVTVEDLVEEIVGEMGKEDDHVAPDIVRESDGSVVLRGSVSVAKLQELFGIEFGDESDQAATTVAGLLNHIAGHVPRTGEQLNYEGLHFEVVEANQRKVLRLRVRPRLLAAPVSGFLS